MSWETLQLEIRHIKQEIRAWSALMQLWIVLLGIMLCVLGSMMIGQGSVLGWWLLASVPGVTLAAVLWTRHSIRKLCIYLELLPYVIVGGYLLDETKTA